MLFVSPERLPLSRRGAMAIGKLSAGCGAALMAFARDNREATLSPSGVTHGDIAADMSVLVKG